ncbi:MAG: AAA family ATPase, partial [Bacilli bacterium]|nr:AAA family ATPase [Bacilli bacterium]
HRIKRRLKSEDLDEDIRQELEKRQQMSRIKSQEIGERIKEIDKNLTSSANEFGEVYISIINEHLNIFAPDLKITKLDKRANKFIYYLKVNDVEIRNGSNSISLRRTLSEGEKNALAFSFFLARLSLNQDMSRTIVVFDDPINSFDAKRRNATKNKLVSIARKSLQFFLLSHDIKFVRDFSDALPSNDILNLKISFDGKTSYLRKHDIKTDTLTGLFKDLRILHDYVNSQDSSDVRPIDVARCLRPVLEGIFRIKYFDRFSENMWLGDMLKEIRDCDQSCALSRQKSNYEELTDINDYSAPFHHESPTYMSVEINSGELLSYCRRVIKLIEKI